VRDLAMLIEPISNTEISVRCSYYIGQLVDLALNSPTLRLIFGFTYDDEQVLSNLLESL